MAIMMVLMAMMTFWINLLTRRNMKTNRIIMAALAFAAAVSCQKVGFEGQETLRETESLTLVTGELTKTSLSGKDVHWTSDDVVAVFDNENYKNKFKITDAQGYKASFSGEVTDGTTQIYAVYPYSLAMRAQGSTLTVSIPEDQTSKVGSFAEEHNISVAKSARTPGVEVVANITFKNVCSYLKFTVPTYVADVTSVTLSTQSRNIAGEATIDFSGDTPVLAPTSNAVNSISMTGSYPAGREFLFVLAPGKIQGCTVTVTNTDGKTWTVTKTSTFTLEAGKYKNLGTLDVEPVGVTASATHTYSGSTLKGTKVNVALNVPTATLQYASDLKIKVRNAAGTVVRSASSNTLTSSVTLDETTSTSWPYLPQGKYTVSGSYKLGELVKTFSSTFDSPAPTFEVTSGAYSSYTKYKNGDAGAANKCTADKIYAITTASVSIADAILNNSNYSSIKGGYTYKLDGEAMTSAEVERQSWGPHTVTAYYKFDNVKKEGSSDCHITGLPYTLNPSANDSVSPWVTNNKGNVKWDTDGSVRIGYNLTSWTASTQTDITKSFNLPADVNVIINCSGNAAGSGSDGWLVDSRINTTFTLSVSGNSVYSYTTTDGSTEQSYSASNKSATMTSASPTIKCHNSYSTATGCTKIKSMTITYGNK